MCILINAMELPTAVEHTRSGMPPIAVVGRGTRTAVGVAQTLLTRTVRGRTKRLPFWGLFALTDIPQGGFLGYYSGDFFDDTDPFAKPKGNHYVFAGSGYTIIPRAEADGQVSPFAYPMSMVNEPPADTQANVDIVEWSTAGQAVTGIKPKSTKVDALALHASRPIAAGEELYLNYGEKYTRRHYPKGTVVGPAANLKRGMVPAGERPRAYLESQGLTTPTDSFQ